MMSSATFDGLCAADAHEAKDGRDDYGELVNKDEVHLTQPLLKIKGLWGDRSLGSSPLRRSREEAGMLRPLFKVGVSTRSVRREV